MTHTHSPHLPPTPAGRLHALDNLRAVMMWLGIVLHVTMVYTVRPMPVPWQDTISSEGADAVVGIIHAFRMPTFFIVAGFFVALLMQMRGAKGMLKNRVARLGAPFALLWPFLFVATSICVLLFVHRAARGTWGMDESLIVPIPGHPKIATIHLWFIWMLLWLSVATFALAPLARVVSAAWRLRLGRVFAWVASSTFGLAALALPLGLLGLGYKGGFLESSGSFMPPLAEWLHNGLFYAFGLALYHQRSVLLAHYQRRWLLYVALGWVFITLSGMIVKMEFQQPGSIPHFAFYSGLVYNLCTWFWSVGVIGLFTRYLHRSNAVLRYLSQASYWVYLIHLPLTIIFGAMLVGEPLSVLAKCLINITATTTVALLSYHLLVRSTPLGALLTGKRYPFALPGLRVAGAARAT
jgi:glucan biosynthesis protein C